MPMLHLTTYLGLLYKKFPPKNPLCVTYYNCSFQRPTVAIATEGFTNPQVNPADQGSYLLSRVAEFPRLPEFDLEIVLKPVG